MIFFYGTRTKFIKSFPLTNNKCAHCDSDDMSMEIYGKYVHFFFIPVFPFGKQATASCNHCQKVLKRNEFDQNLRIKFQNLKKEVSYPKWFFTLLILIFLFIAYIVICAETEKKDPRKDYLSKDIEKATSTPDIKKDSISFRVKNCINSSLSGISTDQIKYYSQLKGESLLLIAKVGDMKGIEPSSRKELLYAIDDCLEEYDYNKNRKVYIIVEGNFSTLLVKAPEKSDLDGKYADESLIFPFYGPDPVDTVKTNK